MRLDLTTVLIWTLRILLPILFFAIYFKLQAPKEKPVVVKDTRNVYSRLKLLQLRKAVKGAAAPDSIKSITFKDQTQAPELFTGSGRERRSERRRGDDETKAPKERKEKKEKKKDPSPETRTFTEERMHLESLLNYVAFQRPEQQRAFLPSHGVAAPPSPPKASTDEEEATDAAKAEAPKAVIVGAQAGKANDEAQMVLKGSMKMKRSDVARNLYDQLVESQVEVAESTYELLIDACVLADDLRGASDFMMKMEAAGFLPKN
jgi:pentatricopeptide repeat protein